MAWRSLRGEDFDETGELSGEIRAQRIQKSRRALAQARGQLQKVIEMLPEGVEDKISHDDLSLAQIDEALERMGEQLAQLASA